MAQYLMGLGIRQVVRIRLDLLRTATRLRLISGREAGPLSADRSRGIVQHDPIPEGATLCSCCVRHGGWDSKVPNTIEEEIVECIECHEPCQCNGCVADFYGQSEWQK